MMLFFLFAVCLFQSAVGFYDLKLLSYTQLATGIRNGVFEYTGMNRGTATDAAYDFVNNIMYVIGETSHFMHVVDISDPINPTVLFVHQFTRGEGIPRSVDVCGDELAVALTAQTTVNEGHVRLYKTFQKGSGATDVVLDGYITVGSHPKSLKYTPDCSTIVVANEGIAGKDESGIYTNPEGTITIIHGEKVGNPTVRLVDFQDYGLYENLYNPKIRTPSLYIPPATLSPQTTVPQDIEPEDLTISNDGKTAWVTLQENNAIAEISLVNAYVTKVTPLPAKSWSASKIDCSDYDGGVHRNRYDGLLSMRQPGVIKSFEIGNNKFLLTGDEGAPKTYTSALHGFAWTDLTTGYNLRQKIDSGNAPLVANASDNRLLGRLQVSSIYGKSQFTNMYTHLETFGGRGYSIWSAKDLSGPEYDSDGTLEEYMEAFDKSVFNTDYSSSTAATRSPENLQDSVSYRQGPQVTGLDIKEDNGTVFLVVGTWSTGMLYLYTVDTSGGQPIPLYETVVRSGVTDYPWADLYNRKQDAGDLYITDLGIIPSDHSPIDSPLLYVVSTGSGSLSLYSIEEI